MADESPYPIDPAMAALKADAPSISDAMKNLCSVIAAPSFVSSDDTTGSMPTPHELPHVLKVAQLVLSSINNHVLLPQHEWAELHPQGADETGAARVEMLTNYRAATLLATQITESAAKGAKLTKLFGRKFLQVSRIWEDGVREAASKELAAAVAAGTLPSGTVDAFLSKFGDAIHGGSSSPSADGGDDDDTASLMWSTKGDFDKALERRREAREKEVRERRERMDKGNDEAESLRSALQAEAADEAADEAAGRGWSENDPRTDDEEDDDEPRVVEVSS